jgi:hypothetical protein
MTPFDRGWRLMRITDPDSDDVVLAAYCAVCAERELDDIAEDDLGQIVGGTQVTEVSRMEFVIDFDCEDADVVVSTTGPADVNGFRQFGKAVTADPRFLPTMSVLLDHSSLDTAELGASERDELQASAFPVRERLAAARVAIVVPDEGRPASARQLGEHARLLNPGARVFRSRAAATDWLRSATGTRAPHQA